MFFTAAVQSVPNGISVYYLGTALWSALFAYLCFWEKCGATRLYTAFLGVAAPAFILRLLPVAALQGAGLVLQSASSLLANLA